MDQPFDPKRLLQEIPIEYRGILGPSRFEVVVRRMQRVPCILQGTLLVDLGGSFVREVDQGDL